MRLMVVCHECLRSIMPDNGVAEAMPPGARLNPLRALTFVEYEDSGLYRFTCRLGHEVTTRLQSERFELLFEIAMHALIDGYYREAVTSFSSALERFCEFAVAVLLKESGIASDLRQDLWKEVAKQSERQHGAHFFLYAAKFGVAPRTLSRAEREFRNDVVHKGLIPSRAQALKFGESVRQVIVEELSHLRGTVLGSLDAVIVENLFIQHGVKTGHVTSVGAISKSSPISAGVDPPRETLEEMLRRLEEQRHHDARLKELSLQPHLASDPEML